MTFTHSPTTAANMVRRNDVVKTVGHSNAILDT